MHNSQTEAKTTSTGKFAQCLATYLSKYPKERYQPLSTFVSRLQSCGYTPTKLEVATSTSQESKAKEGFFASLHLLRKQAVKL